MSETGTPPITLADVPEINARATPKAEAPGSVRPEEASGFKTSQETSSDLSAERWAMNIKKDPVETAAIHHSVESNVKLHSAAERTRIENAIVLAAKIDSEGYDNLSYGERTDACQVVISAMFRQPGFLDRHPGLTPQSAMWDDIVMGEAEAILRNGKYGLALRSELDSTVDPETFLKTELAVAAKAKNDAETKRDQADHEYQTLNTRINTAATIHKSFQETETGAGWTGSRAEALQTTTDQLADAEGKIAEFRLKLDGVQATIDLHTQRGLRDTQISKTGQIVGENGRPMTQSQTETYGRNLDPELKTAQTQRETFATELAKAVTAKTKAEARIKSLEAEKAQARKDAEDPDLVKRRAGAKGELTQAKEDVTAAEQSYQSLEQRSRVAEEAWMKQRANILGVATEKFYQENTQQSIKEQRKVLQKRAEEAGTTMEEAVAESLLVRWISSEKAIRFNFKGKEVGFKRVYKSKEGVSKADIEKVMASPRERDAWFKGFMADAGSLRGMTPDQIDSFLNDPNNTSKLEGIRKDALNTLIQRATVDKALTKAQLRILGTQPWFKQLVQENVKNNPEAAVKNMPQSQIETIWKKSAANPDLLAMLLQVMAGIMLPQELAKGLAKG